MLTNIYDGIAYGSVLFLLACGLSVTLGLMNFINLAHGAFAMAGGYVTVFAVNRYGIPFAPSLLLAFGVSAVLGAVCERLVFRRLYRRPHLDQVLLTIGVVFMAVAGFSYVFGSDQRFVQVPACLTGRVFVGGVGIGIYRLLIIATCVAIAILLQLALSRTRFGSHLRAAVDDGRVARGLGVDVNTVFAVTFAIGSGLAGLGGALGAEILGLDPTFPLKYMVYFLLVVAVGGGTGLAGPFAASLLLGIADVCGKYYIPAAGPFIIYVVMLVVLVWRPQGLLAMGGRR